LYSIAECDISGEPDNHFDFIKQEIEKLWHQKICIISINVVYLQHETNKKISKLFCNWRRFNI
jgi:hypothetical protein